jgi:hypothetical protein
MTDTDIAALVDRGDGRAGQGVTPHQSRPHDNAIGLSETSAGRELGLSRRVIRAAIECGDLKTVKFAGARYIPRNEIERIKRMFMQQ